MNLEGLKIDCISDTHNQHNQLTLPGGDVLIHAGDMTLNGTSKEIFNFLEWYDNQKYNHLILIPGNHDFGFESNAWDIFAYECKKRHINLLNDSGCEVEGIRIWGSPIQPWFHDWAFNRHRGPEIKKHWDLIPENTEILVTHGPPYGILDWVKNGELVGCEELLAKIMKTQIKCHIFGHIHEAYGHQYKNDQLFVNASCLNEYYAIRNGLPIRIVKGVDDIYLIDNLQ